MSELLSGWIKGLTATSVLCSIAIYLTPESRTRDVLKLVCGMILACALVSPFAKFNADGYENNLSEFQERYAGIASEAQKNSDRLVRSIIEDECAAYILDKAQGLRLDEKGVSVTARWDEEGGYWYPWEARISAQRDQALSRTIESDLGIPEERQCWMDE